MDRRKFLKLLAQSSASVGATVFVEKVWGFPVAFPKSQSGKLYMWGQGVAGFNSSSSTTIPTPTKVTPSHKWKNVMLGTSSGANSGVAFGTDHKGQIFAWGNNINGQLGPTAGSVSNPTLFGTLINWQSISSYSTHSVGLKVDGSIWAWGNNTYGQFGTAVPTNSSSPIRIGTENTWVKAYAGLGATFALNNAGEVWATGSSTSGYLGAGQGSGNYPVLTKVPSVIPWSKISVAKDFVLGIKTDGTLWAWGSGGDGQLGNAQTLNVSTPIQIGSLTTWSKVFSSFGVSFAIRNDNTLWAWGYNGTGNLGIGSIASKSSPVQVPGSWSEIAPSEEHTIALRTDGTLWGWGRNDVFQLGVGNTINYSSPIQIGTSLWQSVMTTGTTSAAIRK
ncbi:RCC1 domain-containing protein [Bdellovibrio sp. HCB2-146]|uniref:RCC1 domain-containing protein n=1 Tax=Bdellovibrio sp. HCB2-146 TaxID=3394362 RepID=UPI0039BD1ADD